MTHKVEVIKPGDGTFNGTPEIAIDGKVVPGVTHWVVKGGTSLTFPQLILECEVGVPSLAFPDAHVEYRFDLPDDEEFLTSLHREVKRRLECIKASVGESRVVRGRLRLLESRGEGTLIKVGKEDLIKLLRDFDDRYVSISVRVIDKDELKSLEEEDSSV